MRHIFSYSLAAISLSALISGGAHSQESQPNSPYGADDTLGALNLLTDDHVLSAAQLIQTGKTYSLGIVTGRDTPAWGDRSYDVEIASLGPFGSNDVTAHDDRLVANLGIGSQIDGFAHAGISGVHYNGHKASDFASPDGVQLFGTESLPPIVTRGVLIDMAAHMGVERLDAGMVFNTDEIRAALESQNVQIQSGDVVLFHTGWMSIMEEDPQTYLYNAPGIGLEGAAYLADLGVVALGADTGGLEVEPYGSSRVS